MVTVRYDAMRRWQSEGISNPPRSAGVGALQKDGVAILTDLQTITASISRPFAGRKRSSSGPVTSPSVSSFLEIEQDADQLKVQHDFLISHTRITENRKSQLSHGCAAQQRAFRFLIFFYFSEIIYFQEHKERRARRVANKNEDAKRDLLGGVR